MTAHHKRCTIAARSQPSTTTTTMKAIPKTATTSAPIVTITPVGKRGTKHVCTIGGIELGDRTSLHRNYTACVVLISDTEKRLAYYKAELEKPGRATWHYENCRARIEETEELLANGQVLATVSTWCGNRYLATKQVGRWQGQSLYSAVIIAEAV